MLLKPCVPIEAKEATSVTAENNSAKTAIRLLLVFFFEMKTIMSTKKIRLRTAHGMAIAQTIVAFVVKLISSSGRFDGLATLLTPTKIASSDAAIVAIPKTKAITMRARIPLDNGAAGASSFGSDVGPATREGDEETEEVGVTTGSTAGVGAGGGSGFGLYFGMMTEPINASSHR